MGRRLAVIVMVAFAITPAGVAAGDTVARAPVVPRLKGALRAHVQRIARRGRELGNERDVFAKVGDSITYSGSFLQDMACEAPTWGRWGELRSTREFFRRHRFPDSYASIWCGRADSFSRASLTAVSGWDASQAVGDLDGGPGECDGALDHPLDCEYHLLRPSVALVMYGTNDLGRFGPAAYRRNLARIVERSTDAGVIPVLSTIPPRLDSDEAGRRVAVFNRRVVGLAHSRRVPLWNYWRSLQGADMVHSGIDEGGVHPNLYGNCEQPLGCRAPDFTDEGLRYGYNQRNLGALRVLAAIRRAAL